MKFIFLHFDLILQTWWNHFIYYRKDHVICLHHHCIVLTIYLVQELIKTFNHQIHHIFFYFISFKKVFMHLCIWWWKICFNAVQSFWMFLKHILITRKSFPFIIIIFVLQLTLNYFSYSFVLYFNDTD